MTTIDDKKSLLRRMTSNNLQAKIKKKVDGDTRTCIGMTDRHQVQQRTRFTRVLTHQCMQAFKGIAVVTAQYSKAIVSSLPHEGNIKSFEEEEEFFLYAILAHQIRGYNFTHFLVS